MRRKITAAAAATAVIAALAVTAPAATAATPQCGSACVSLYNLIYGNADVLGVADPSGTNASPGQPVTLQPASSSNQGEDWGIDFHDTVTNLAQAGLLSSTLAQHYGSDVAYEFEYVPDNVATGLCLGLADSVDPAFQGETIALDPCGVDGHTLWIADLADRFQRQIPYINGTDTDFTFPYVLTADTAGNTATVGMLTGGDGVTDLGQYWATEFGVLGS